MVGLAAVGIAVAVAVAGLAGPDAHGARVVRLTLHSERLHRSLPVVAVVPAGRLASRRPLLIFLHGRGGNEDSSLDSAMFTALARQGARAPDVVFPDGGTDSYWHDRAGGAWGSYVLDEVIPAATPPRGPSTMRRTSPAMTSSGPPERGTPTGRWRCGSTLGPMTRSGQATRCWPVS